MQEMNRHLNARMLARRESSVKTTAPFRADRTDETLTQFRDSYTLHSNQVGGGRLCRVTTGGTRDLKNA
jgi:hypothetical protein